MNHEKNKLGETNKNHNCQQYLYDAKINTCEYIYIYIYIYMCMVSYKELGEYLLCVLCLNAACLASCFLLALPSLVIGSHGNIKHDQRPWQPNRTSAAQSDNSGHKHIQWQHLLLHILEATLHNLQAIKHSTWFIHDNRWQPVKTHSWVHFWIWIPLFVPYSSGRLLFPALAGPNAFRTDGARWARNSKTKPQKDQP